MKGWRIFFAFAALFNVTAGLIIILSPQLFYRMLFIPEPLPAGAKVYVDLFAVLVITFGWAYWMISRDPQKYLSFVLMGIIGKLLVVFTAWYHALAGSGPLNFAILTLADLTFALLFLRFYQLSTRARGVA